MSFRSLRDTLKSINEEMASAVDGSGRILDNLSQMNALQAQSAERVRGLPTLPDSVVNQGPIPFGGDPITTGGVSGDGVRTTGDPLGGGVRRLGDPTGGVLFAIGAQLGRIEQAIEGNAQLASTTARNDV